MGSLKQTNKYYYEHKIGIKKARKNRRSSAAKSPTRSIDVKLKNTIMSSTLFDQHSRRRIFEQILGTGITGIFALFGVFLWNSATNNSARAELNRVNIEANREVFTQKIGAMSLEFQKLQDEIDYGVFEYAPPPVSTGDEAVPTLPAPAANYPKPNFTEQIQQSLDKEIYRRGAGRGLE